MNGSMFWTGSDRAFATGNNMQFYAVGDVVILPSGEKAIVAKRIIEMREVHTEGSACHIVLDRYKK